MKVLLIATVISFQICYGIGAMLEKKNYKASGFETEQQPGEYKFWIPIRDKCIHGDSPLKISSKGAFEKFSQGLDYLKIKNNTTVKAPPSSDWRLCFTTNLIVFVFHNRKRVLGGRVNHHRGASHSAANIFIDNEAQVCSFLYNMHIYTIP